MFTWLRMSSSKLLTWARRSNYQSKDISWMQQVTSNRLSETARSAKDPWVRTYARLTLAGLPRGSSSGDDIRMGILHIMRDNGIKEGHRPVSGEGKDGVGGKGVVKKERWGWNDQCIEPCSQAFVCDGR